MQTIHVISQGTLSANDLTGFPATGGTLFIDGPVTLAATLSIPSTLRVIFTNAGSLFVGMHSIAFGLAIEAGDHAIFLNAASGNITFIAGSCQDEVRAGWWGAASDGSAAVNQNALTAAFAALPGAGCVRLGPGTFSLSQTVVIPDGFLLKGSGAECTTIEWKPAVGGTGTGTALLAEGNVFVEDLRLLGPGVVTASGTASCGLRGGATLRVRDVTFEKFDCGLSIVAAEQATVEHCDFRANRVGVSTDGGRDIFLRDCRFDVSAAGGTAVVVGRNGADETGRSRNVQILDSDLAGAIPTSGRTGVQVVLGRLVLVRDCRVAKLARGVAFEADSVDDIGAEVGRCRFAQCVNDVDKGKVAARVRVLGRGGMSSLAFMQASAPDEPGWRPGDRIRNGTPKNGEPLGWVCTGIDATTKKPRWMAYAWVGEFVWKPWKGEERKVDDDSAADTGLGVFKKKTPDRPWKIAGTHHYDVPVDTSPKR
jgi:hypothetical protein